MRKLLIFLAAAGTLIAAGFELGKVPCTIYHVSRNALQAREMADFLKKVYGHTYPVKVFREKYRQFPGIFIGVRPANLKMDFDETLEYCVRHITGDQLYLFGNRDARLKGTAFAVYDFLEEVCGVRYLWPGELGTVAEPAAPVTLKDETRKTVPFFTRRMVNSYHYGINSLAAPDAYALNRWQEHHRVGTSRFGSAAHRRLDGNGKDIDNLVLTIFILNALAGKLSRYDQACGARDRSFFIGQNHVSANETGIADLQRAIDCNGITISNRHRLAVQIKSAGTISIEQGHID